MEKLGIWWVKAGGLFEITCANRHVFNGHFCWRQLNLPRQNTECERLKCEWSNKDTRIQTDRQETGRQMDTDEDKQAKAGLQAHMKERLVTHAVRF